MKRTFKSPYLDENVMIKTPTIISDYTCRVADVVPQLSYFLSEVEHEAGHPYPGEHGIPHLAYQDDEHSFWESDAAFDLWVEMVDAIQEYAPPYTTVGANEGDGSCIGVWPVVDIAVDDFNQDGLTFEDPGDVPEDSLGLWLEVNDHGNVSLYFRDDQGNDTELWAVV